MGRLGHARSPRRLLATPMLPFERKASPSCMGRTIVVNGRMSCFAWLISRRNSITGSAHRSALRFKREPSHQASRVLARSVRLDSRMDILAKAPTDSMTPTTKLVPTCSIAPSKGVASGDRQLFQFRRRCSKRFGSIAYAKHEGCDANVLRSSQAGAGKLRWITQREPHSKSWEPCCPRCPVYRV